MQIPQWNQRNPFLRIPNPGAIVCKILTRPWIYATSLNDQSTPTVTMRYGLYDVTTSSPLRGFYFWHFKCWICCLVFKNPNQNVRTRGQSRTAAHSLQRGCQAHTGLTEPSGRLGSFTASDQKKRHKNKAHRPSSRGSCRDAIR